MTLAPTSRAGGSTARSSPNLDAQMRTVRAQLEDWVTCPSAKTPEGKAKIERLNTRLASIESQIEKSDRSPPSVAAARSARAAASTAPAGATDGSADPAGRIGTLLDAYA